MSPASVFPRLSPASAERDKVCPQNGAAMSCHCCGFLCLPPLPPHQSSAAIDFSRLRVPPFATNTFAALATPWLNVTAKLQNRKKRGGTPPWVTPASQTRSKDGLVHSQEALMAEDTELLSNGLAWMCVVGTY